MPSSPDRAPRVLMVVPQFHPLRGGTENQAFELARRLAGDGCQVTVLTTRQAGLPPVERTQGILIHRGIRFLAAGKLFGLTYVASVLSYLLRRGWRYDILHAQFLNLDAIGTVLFARLARKPCLAKAACSGEYGDVARVRSLRGGALLLRILRSLDRVVALSGHMRRELLENGFQDGKTVVIPNGVDVDRFSPPEAGSADRTSLAAGGGAVLFVGRLTAQKDWKTLLNGFKLLRGRLKGATLQILGAGPDLDAFRLECRRLGLEECVELLDGGRDPLPCLRRADAFVLPTLSEGMSNALLEAMATGLPCVATRIEANEEVIDHGRDGLLFNTGSAQALADALHLVLTDRAVARSLGAAARRKAVMTYSLDLLLRRYRQLYAELLEPR